MRQQIAASRVKISTLEDWHFWFAGRRNLVLSLIERFIKISNLQTLDVGCGTGSLVEKLRELGAKAFGVDLSVIYMISKGHRNLSEAKAEALPFADNNFELVTVCDVLEHLDDVSAIREIYRVMKPTGRAIITVPAHMWLWSYRDEVAQHLRRYSVQELKTKLEDAGLKIVHLQFYQSLLLPAFIFSRLIAKLFKRTTDHEEKISPLTNYVLKLLNALELKLSNYIILPWGSSIVVIAEKQLPH
ncbi:class I SAM-dependent methyltransferase [bacterium]|nr:class I SAM-dependent methyltransferase [bacterium]